MKDLDCSTEINIALVHLKNGTPNLALGLLSGYKGCHLKHQTCEYRGEDCAVQDLIAGFFDKYKESDFFK